MNFDYILVLGGPLNGEEPGGILLERLKKAALILEENPELKAVCSGGMTHEGQTVSEAQVMKKTLIKLGVPEGRIILEDKAKTTLENFKYTKELLGDDVRVAFVTSEFHIKRSCLIMKKAGVDYTPIAAPNSEDSRSYRIREAFLRPLARLGIIW